MPTESFPSPFTIDRAGFILRKTEEMRLRNDAHCKHGYAAAGLVIRELLESQNCFATGAPGVGASHMRIAALELQSALGGLP